jgi:hypothetical protein
MRDVAKNADLAFRGSSDAAGSANGKVMFRGTDIYAPFGRNVKICRIDIQTQCGGGEKKQN